MCGEAGDAVLCASEQCLFQCLFQCLLLWDELEYSLPSDDVPYRARPMSRWDSPEFVMVFASILRSLTKYHAKAQQILSPALAPLYTEDVGGECLDVDVHDPETAGLKMERGTLGAKIGDWDSIRVMLYRRKEIAATLRRGRYADAHKHMRSYDELFGSSLQR